MELGELGSMANRTERQAAEEFRTRFLGRLEWQMRTDGKTDTDIEAAKAQVMAEPIDYWIELQAGRRPPSDM